MRDGDAAADAGGAQPLTFQQVSKISRGPGRLTRRFAGQFLQGLFFAVARRRAITRSRVIKSINSMSHIHFSEDVIGGIDPADMPSSRR